MYTYKTLIRDKLVADSTIKSLFSAAASGSTWINMENLNVSAHYPQIIISYGGGETMPNMSTDNPTMYLTVECKGTGSIHAHKEVGKFRSAILDVVDDTSLQSNTAVCYQMRKFSEVEGYDEDEKVWFLRMGFEGFFKQNSNFP